jgi:hypothetical protein
MDGLKACPLCAATAGFGRCDHGAWVMVQCVECDTYYIARPVIKRLQDDQASRADALLRIVRAAPKDKYASIGYTIQGTEDSGGEFMVYATYIDQGAAPRLDAPGR